MLLGQVVPLGPILTNKLISKFKVSYKLIHKFECGCIFVIGIQTLLVLNCSCLGNKALFIHNVLILGINLVLTSSSCPKLEDVGSYNELQEI